MNKQGVFAAGFLAALISAAAHAQVWTELGPAPVSGFSGATGRVSAVVCSPTDANLWYIGGADGGVWRTRNAGSSWTPLTDDQPTTAIGALAMDPADNRILYAGTGEGNFANHSRYGLGLLKSIDGGDTWQVLAPSTFAGRCFSKIVIDRDDPRVLYAAVVRAGGFPMLAAAKGHVQATGPTGVFKSLDGGVSWTQLAGGLPALDATDLAMDPANSAVLYAAIGYIFGSPENGVYKSVDHGATWTKLTSGLPTGAPGRISVAVAPSDANRVYALFVNAANATGGGANTLGGFRSDNAGASFAPITMPSFQNTFGWYLAPITVQPTNPDVVFFGGVTLQRTVNAGTSFVNASVPHPDVHALVWDAAGALISGDDGGVHRTVNLGASWTSHNIGLGIIQFYAGLSTHPFDDILIIGGTQDNGTNIRPDTSFLWESVNGGDGGWTQINQANPAIVFAEAQGTGTISRSTNGGLNFTDVGAGLTGRNCFLPPYLIDPEVPGRMLYATERVWVSVNSGSNFTPLSADLTGGGSAAIRALAMAPSDSSYVYAATNDGRVLASQDGGATFALVLTGNAGWPRVTRELFVDPSDPRTVYLAGATFGAVQVRRSRDAGATWEALDAGLPDVPVNVVAADNRSIVPTLFAGADNGVYISTTNGATWRRYGAGLPNAAVVDLLLQPSRGRIIAGTQGRGAWSVPLLIYCTADFNGDGDTGTDADIEAFFACLGGNCCAACASPDFDGDGDTGTDADIESFFRVLGGGAC